MSTREASQEREARPLSVREKHLMERLLSDPFSYPLTFKTWHVRSLELSDLTLQRTNILGLDDALASAGTTNLLGGVANVTTDAGGAAHIAFPATVGAVKSVVLTNNSPAHANANFSALNLTTGGFDILAWNVPTNVPLASVGISVSWIAFITPLT